MKKAFKFVGNGAFYDYESGAEVDGFQGRVTVFGDNMGLAGSDFVTWIDEDGRRNWRLAR